MGTCNHKREGFGAIIPNMGKNVIQILAANLERNLGPGRRFASLVELGTKAGVGKSSIVRIKNANNAATLKSLQGIAEAYRLEAWQFLVPDLDVDNPHRLLSEDLNAIEIELLSVFQRLTEPEKRGLVATGKAMADGHEDDRMPVKSA